MAKSTRTRLTRARPASGQGPPDPKNRQAFREWLAKQPREWSVTIAARAALRVLPLLQGADNVAALVFPVFPATVLSVFRATAIARFAAKYPNRAIDAYAAAATAARAAADAARTADAAYAAARTAAAAAAYAAADAADAASAYAATAAQHDAQRLHDGVLTAEKLARDPLWPIPAPAEFTDAWQRLSAKLLTLGPHWRVWTNWYENVALHEPHRGISEAEDAAYTDIPGKLPWDAGAEAVNTEIARRLAELRGSESSEIPELPWDAGAEAVNTEIARRLGSDPVPVEGIPSPIAITLRPDGRIGADAGALSALSASLTPEDHARALAACRGRAEQLRTMAVSPKFQGRREYGEALAAYLDWLPTAPGFGNILLADGEARVLNKLFTADEGILSPGFAGRLSVLLEDHIGLRTHYSELERHYDAIRTGRLATPLSRDAVEAIRKAIHANTPDVFDESVSPAMDEVARPIPDVTPPAPEDAPPPDLNRPKPPKDPIAEVDPAKSRNFVFASAANRIWEILRSGKHLHEGAEGWQKTYEQFKPHIITIIDWLKHFMSGGGDGMPPMPPMIST
jgi:hypothetical protein